jgi:hypothetical protein
MMAGISRYPSGLPVAALLVGCVSSWSQASAERCEKRRRRRIPETPAGEVRLPSSLHVTRRS